MIGGELQERLIPVPYSKNTTDQAVSCSLPFFVSVFVYSLAIASMACSFCSVSCGNDKQTGNATWRESMTGLYIVCESALHNVSEYAALFIASDTFNVGTFVSLSSIHCSGSFCCCCCCCYGNLLTISPSSPVWICMVAFILFIYLFFFALYKRISEFGAGHRSWGFIFSFSLFFILAFVFFFFLYICKKRKKMRSCRYV